MCYGLYVDLPGLLHQQNPNLPGTHYAYIFSAYKNAYKEVLNSLGHIFSLKSSLLALGSTDCK